MPQPDLTAVLCPGDALIIVPPFIQYGAPAIGAHLLQACARAAGHRVSVLYANVIFGALLGDAEYMAVVNDRDGFRQERIFAPIAFGPPPPACASDEHGAPTHERFDGHAVEPGGEPAPWRDDRNDPNGMAQKAAAWTKTLAAAVVQCGFRVVGCTVLTQQISASVALLAHIKRLRPETVTIIGGASCAGEMAEGIASLTSDIDFAFSGESETSFVRFLDQVRAGRLPGDRVVAGEPCPDLDALPAPVYTEYFEQMARYRPARPPSELWLSYEGSRGCWWGEKHHCKFCGALNDAPFRMKSPGRVVSEMRRLVADHPSRRILAVDSIMPLSYLESVIPQIAADLPNVQLFWEVKPNLTLRQLRELVRAGVKEVQPGIEAFSTSLLRRMSKGVSAAQNIAFLRYARAIRLIVHWNLLYGVPGDESREYEETLALLPLLRHLMPPNSWAPVRLDRFSPYTEHPSEYGIANLRPAEAYAAIFPAHADIRKLAYVFEGDFESASVSASALVSEIQAQVTNWRAAWIAAAGQPPALRVDRLGDRLFILRDTRGLPGTRPTQLLDREQAEVALLARRSTSSPAVKWALTQRLGVVLDERYVPLATAPPELLSEFEAGAKGRTPVPAMGGARRGVD